MINERERNVPRRNPVVAPQAERTLDWRTRLAIRLGGWLLRALGATWRVRVYGRQALLDRASSAERVVFTLWHGQMLPVVWAHRQPTAVMISEHRDGEIIAQVIGGLGFSAIRGSTSRGGARALLTAVQTLKGGNDVAITPDGPRGPQHSFAPGALLLAYRASAAVIPIVAHVDRKWQLRSWDGFEIPKPFARVTVVYGTPVRPQGNDAREVAEQAPQFAERMLLETERARSLGAGEWLQPLAPFAP